MLDLYNFISTISLSVSYFSFKVEEVEKNRYINICFFITFRRSRIVAPNKIYKVHAKFFITITAEVKFAFIQLDFKVNVTMI